MSPKATQKSAVAKKESGKKNSKSQPNGKIDKKHVQPQEEIQELTPAALSAEADELEDAEEDAEASSGSGGNAAALAAAGGGEMSASFKNFRHHPDMENFYRFIFENDLRHEALAIIDEIIVDKAEKRNQKVVK